VAGGQRVRSFLFYSSLLVFFAGLPFILTFALGFQFDRKTFKFTKTGLLVLKTNPPGASVTLNDKLLNEKTPATLNELLPGDYRFSLELEGYYPYSADVQISPGKVTKLERIILFPLRFDVPQLNQDVVSYFWLDESKANIYFIDTDTNAVFRSDLHGEHFKSIATFIPILPFSKKWELSPDRTKLMYHNWRQIGIVYLEPDEQQFLAKPAFVLNCPDNTLNNVFWYSDSYHLILLGDKRIEVLEARPDSSPLTILKLNKKRSVGFYDTRADTLYFQDSQLAQDNKSYDNVYKLELNKKLFNFQDLIKIKQNEQQ